MAELQDTAGLCEGRVTALDMDALKVRSDEQLELNEFMLYHGSDASKFERLYHQGLDPRYAGSNAGKMYGFGTYLATNSSKSDRYAQPNDAGEQCIFVVRTLLAESHPETLQFGTPGYAERSRAVQKWRLPPERPDGRGPLSSVSAVTAQHGGAVEHPASGIHRVRATPVPAAIRHLVHPPARLLLPAMCHPQGPHQAPPLSVVFRGACGLRSRPSWRPWAADP